MSLNIVHTNLAERTLLHVTVGEEIRRKKRGNIAMKKCFKFLDSELVIAIMTIFAVNATSKKI